MDSRWRFKGTALRTLMAQERAQLMAKERAQIFSLYEQGPRKRLFVDIGDENKDNDEFISDRFGFLREKPQPRDSALGTKQRRTESRRLRKWVKMLNNYSKYYGSKKFQQRCFKGIPSEVRGRVWKLMLSVDIKKAQNPGTFEVLKEQARLHCDQVHEIDTAVHWTFRNHLIFRERYGMKQRALFEVLVAYAMYNPEVGYGQGLSHIAALLLMWLSEEDAFWALVQLMENEKYLMSGLYKPGSPMLETLQEHLRHIMHRTLPTLQKHLEKQGVRLSDTIAHWFTQGFLDEVPFPLALRIWDIFILEGTHILTTVASVALKLNQKRLLKMPRNQIQEFLQVTLKQAWNLDNDVVIKKLQASKRDLAKRQCLLLPSETKPGEACSRNHGQIYNPEKPASKALQGRDTAQDQGPPCQPPESPDSLTESSFSEPPTIYVDWVEDTEEEENSSDEDIFECLNRDTQVQAQVAPRGPSITKTPWNMWHEGRLLQWWSLPNLQAPVTGADGPLLEMGSQEGLCAPLHSSKPLAPGPTQAIQAPSSGLKIASLHDFHRSTLDYGDSDGLGPPQA